MNRTRTSSLDAFGLRDQRNRIYPTMEGSDGSTLSLDFTAMSGLDSRFTFSRSSPATFINSSGLVQYADHNLVVNSALDGAGTGNAPTSWTGSTGINLTIPSAETRRAETTTAAQNWTAAQTFTSQIGITYSTSVLITSVSGQHYANTVSVVGSPTLVGYYRNGASVGQFATAQAGLITVVWTATSTNTHAMRVGVGSTGANVANAVCEFTQPQTIVGNNLQPAYIANTSTSSALQLARFDYDPSTLAPRGLLIESSATNLWTYSQDQSQWAVSNVTVNTGTQATAPDGTTSLFPVLTNTTSAVQYFVRQRSADSITATAGQVYTYSMFVKKGTHRYVQMFASATTLFTSAAQANFDLDDGTTGNVTNCTPTAVAYGNGWWKLSIAVTANTSGTQSQPFVLYLVSSKTAVRGETLSLSSQSIYVWGAQVELGSGASSYIPTGASTVQRAADVCDMTGTNFSSWFVSGSPYSMLFKYSMNNPSAWAGSNVDRGAGLLSASGYVDPRVFINAAYRVASGSGDIGRFIRVYDSGTLDMFPGTYPAAASNTALAFAVDTNNSAVYGANQVVGTDSTNTLLTGYTQFSIGRVGGSSQHINGCIRQIKYWPQRLPNATLQGLVV